jgi:hypothetical protein
VWVQRLLAPGAAIATIALLHYGFGVSKTLAIILPTFGAHAVLDCCGPRSENSAICEWAEKSLALVTNEANQTPLSS